MVTDIHEYHHHHHHHPEPANLDSCKGRMFLIGTLLNAIYVIAEFTAGFHYGSMGLLADAGHNLGDVAGLLLSLGAFLLARKHHTATFTYGYKKSTILASLINAVLLFVAVRIIICECIQKFIHPAPVDGLPIMLTAGIGIVVNGLTVLLFMKNKEHDLNVKSAYMHMLGDTLVSIGVVVSGAIISLTGFTAIDPIIGLVVAIVIIASAWELLRESIRLALDGVPSNIDTDMLQKNILNIECVTDIHHIHVWPISTTENAITAHVVLTDITRMEEIKSLIRNQLTQYGIAHSTIEFETKGTTCKNTCDT